MSLFKKKNVKEEELEFLPSALNTPVRNYKVYKMSKKEELLYFLAAFAVGAIAGYIFYGGIGQDEYGPTITTYICNVIISSIVGYIFGKIFVPIRKTQIIDKRKRQLRTQFISLLDSLATSIAAGKNVPMAFESARSDLAVQFSEDAYIVEEIDVILNGLKNNIAVETLLADFGRRSGINDIENFGKVFEISYRRGADLKEVIRNTHDILSKKIVIEAEIETKITSGKNELNIMLFMPVLLIAMIKFSDAGFAQNFVTPTGILATTIGVGMFIAAFYIGRAVMKIEV